MISIPRPLRLVVAAAALAAPLAAIAPAQATAPVLGAVSVNPATGMASETSTLLETHGTCPAGSQWVKARLHGPGITDDNSNNLVGNTSLGILNSNSFGGYEMGFSSNSTFADVLLRYGVVAPSADYTIEVICGDNSLNVYGTYTGVIHIAHGVSDGPGDGTYTSVASGAPTTTVLGASPTQPVTAGTSSTLTATVTPSDAAGTVQFKRGGVNVGAPANVVSGVATYNGALSAGSGALTAVFTPTDATAFKTSTSDPVSYVVAGKPVVSGTVAVGRVVSCVATAGGSQTYKWLINGVVQSGYAGYSATIPASWLSKSLSCTDTVTVAANHVDQTSAGRAVALGAALRVTVRPTLAGIFRVGKLVSCRHGSWSPAATTYSYQWLRDGRVIRAATKATYRLVRADRGHKISCRVVARRTGYHYGTATTAVKRVA